MSFDVLGAARRVTAEGTCLIRTRQIVQPAPLSDTASLLRTVLP